MFSHSIWNCYTSVIEGIPIANNCVEGWSNKVNRLVGCAHSNICTLLNKIKDEQEFNEIKMDQIESGVELPKSKRIFVEKYERITRICGTYDNQNIMNFLRRISYNITFN
ncbi:hypothetical protein HZS_5007 [Henneguya salminicola]|nr:hypothetical protein HZS_5007 [Henneguya salminicola]